MKNNYINQFQRDILVGEDGGTNSSSQKQSIFSIEDEYLPQYNQMDKAKLLGICEWIKAQPQYKNLPVTNEKSLFYYVAPLKFAELIKQYEESQMLPIIKELLETLIKANFYVPPKFYGQGESVDNDHYLEIQTTLDKYKQYL